MKNKIEVEINNKNVQITGDKFNRKISLNMISSNWFEKKLNLKF